jgi:[phosphatase 2A protein]-leucine-carboxy methyltransferase
VSSLVSRFLGHGYTTANALTLRDIRRDYIIPSELERYLTRFQYLAPDDLFSSRIAKLEMLDEIEELELVLQHYAITYGFMLPHGKDAAVWTSWGLHMKRMPDKDD